MRSADFLHVELPSKFLEGSLSRLLDMVFSAAEDERREITGRFNLQENPDLPEIYAVFLAVSEEWRDWRCALRVQADGVESSLDSPASGFLASGEDSFLLSIRLEQRYCPLEYAVRHGFWDSHDRLLDWMRSLTALYFLDKHEVSIEAGDVRKKGPALSLALESLREQGLIAPAEAGEAAADDTSENEHPGEDPCLVITPDGRRFIAGLLSETESCIDTYDHYQDALADADPDSGTVEFGTGRGVDLRVQAYLVEELDPVRTVFLLRLYDGTLDSRLQDWEAVLESEEFFEAVLEPVVNRDSVALEEMEQVIEFGYAWLEDRQERELRDAADRELLRRAGGEVP